MPSGPEGQLRFGISEKIHGSYKATNEAGFPVLLIPLAPGRMPANRAAGDVSLLYASTVHFELGVQSFASYAAIVQCNNLRLANTFAVLIADLARAVWTEDSLPSAADVSVALAHWESLLRGTRELSREDELGLWGELWFLRQFTDVHLAVAAWRGGEGGFVDFVGGGVGIECKASHQRCFHFVSQEQLVRPLGDVDAYLLSMWVDADETAGTTINDLISDISAQLEESTAFEQKLLSWGYKSSDSLRYTLRLRMLERPLLFRVAQVPRVRTFDAGVSRIRFLANLDETAALPEAEAIAVTFRLTAR